MNHRRVRRLWLWSSAAVGAALVALGAVGSALASGNPYCQVSPAHTMCRYKGVSASCRARMVKRGLTAEDVQLVLGLHNRLRSRVATGREFRGYQPPAADMRKLEWDEQLASIAQRWVDQCNDSHDACRDLANQQVGQNLFVVYGAEKDTLGNWTATIYSWYNEVELFDTSNVENFRELGKSSHYSQLVTAATRLLGCGYAAWRDGRPESVTSMFTCNYAPSGNRFGQPVYNVGRPCGRCPPAHRCSRRRGLCESHHSIPPSKLLLGRRQARRGRRGRRGRRQ